jgi:undecaprenyl-diphosphatase
MEIFDAVIYGLIQGITEFLPVSSSGHLALLPSVISVRDPGVEFDIMMHLGTALSVIVFYRRKLKRLFFALPHAFVLTAKEDTDHNEDIGFLRNIIFTTFITLIFAFILKKFSFQFGRSPQLIAINLMVFGFFLWLADRKSFFNLGTLKEKWNWKAGLYLGIMQSLAVFPGVSRSGILLTGTRSVNIGREEATEFTFLLSLPIIFAAILYKIPAILVNTSTVPGMYWLIGTFVSFAVGYLVIHFFLALVLRIGFFGFFLYRLLLGLGILYFISN